MKSMLRFVNRIIPKNNLPNDIPPTPAPAPPPPLLPVESIVVPNINEYVKEWLAIENIATKDFGQKYLVNYPNNEHDPCEDVVVVDDCEDNKEYKCRTYFSNSKRKETCVFKGRIKKFEAPNTIVGKDTHNYEIKESVFFKYVWIRGYQVAIFYHIMVSEVTNNVYILFPTGGVFEKDEFNENVELKKFLQVLIDKILNTEFYQTKKIIICGHSMGCVLSIYTGMMIKEQNKSFFDKNVVIIGSAPFKYANDESFSNLKNVMIFVFALSKENGNRWEIDGFTNEGPCEFNYKPITYITNATSASDEDASIINISEGTYTYLKYGSKLCSIYHNWESYQSVLSEIYNERQDGGNKRSKSNKRNIKKKG